MPKQQAIVDADAPQDPYRRTGRSTRQLKRLPTGGWFFSNSVEEHQHLARSNGRWDIRVLHVSMLNPDKLRGQRAIACDLDHAAVEVLTAGQAQALCQFQKTQVALP